MTHAYAKSMATALIVLVTHSTNADVVFTPLISDMGGSPSTITFDEFAVGTDLGAGSAPLPPDPPIGLAVPGRDVVLEGTMTFRVGQYDDWFPGDVVPGFWAGHGMFNPAGSIVGQVFRVRFGTPVSAAGLVLFNNFGATERTYSVRVYGADGALLAEHVNEPVIAVPEFLGFKSDTNDIAAFELGIGITFNTGRRPFFDTITYSGVQDADADGIDDSVDNCTLVANAAQRDTDDDGIGNACDADFNNDCTVNAQDLGILRLNFFSADPDTDLNGDGAVNATELGIMRSQFFETPGPSAWPNVCD